MDLIDEHGPAVTHYPAGHPLVAQSPHRETYFGPSDRSGYEGVDPLPVCQRFSELPLHRP